MTKKFIIDLKKEIKDNAPAFKTIGLFNNQFLNEAREKAFLYPCAFLEFRDVLVKKDQVGNRILETTIVIHVGHSSLKYKDDDATIFELIEDLVLALENWTTCFFTPLQNTGIKFDHNHDGVQVAEMEFKTTIIDDTTNSQKNLIKLNEPVDLDINKKIDIDNATIRSGDGVFN